LLPVFESDGQFCLLALSQHAVRLFQGTRDTLSELQIEGLPDHLAESLTHEAVGKHIQVRSAVPAQGSGGTVIFYGGGDVGQAIKSQLLSFCYEVDRRVCAQLKDGGRPMVLAGVDYLLSLYREVSHYPLLVEAEIPGNPDRLNADELHARAWALIQPIFQMRQTEALAHYQQLAGTSRISTSLDDILPAAGQGRVETLFIVLGLERWGRFHPSAGLTQVHPGYRPGDEELLDHAAIQTFLNGGAVYAVPLEEMPAAAPVAAVFRY
jgi:hypothetical protein